MLQVLLLSGHSARCYEKGPVAVKAEIEPSPARSTMNEKWTDSRTGNDVLTHVFGGSPAGVLARLVLASILVGFILHTADIDPWNIFLSLEGLVHWMWKFGLAHLLSLWQYFILGAVIVVPIWLLTRVLGKK
jgi:hypothetical protein